MLLIIGNKRLQDTIARAMKEANEKGQREATEFLSRYKTVGELQEKINKLGIEASRKQEEFDRREREVEHKVGLERKRQEFEIEQAKRETTTSVREENLKADKERFKAEMDFQRKRLEEEVSSLRDLVQKMLERLPSAEIYADLSGRKK